MRWGRCCKLQISCATTTILNSKTLKKLKEKLLLAIWKEGSDWLIDSLWLSPISLNAFSKRKTNKPYAVILGLSLKTTKTTLIVQLLRSKILISTRKTSQCLLSEIPLWSSKVSMRPTKSRVYFKFRGVIPPNLFLKKMSISSSLRSCLELQWRTF